MKIWHPIEDVRIGCQARCPRLDSNHHSSRHRPSTCCVYHSATRANLDKLHMHITPILAICQRVESLFFYNTLQRTRRQFDGISAKLSSRSLQCVVKTST